MTSSSSSATSSRLSYDKPVSLKAVKTPDQALAYTDFAYISSNNLPNGCTVCTVESKKGKLVLMITEHKDVPVGKLAFNSQQRTFLDLSLEDETTVKLCKTSILSTIAKVKTVVLEIDILKKLKEPLAIDWRQFNAIIQKYIKDRILNVGHTILLNYENTPFTLKMIQLGDGLETVACLDDDFTITPIAMKSLKLSGLGKGAAAEINLDFKAMGVGGLDTELQDLIRRAFLSRALPPRIAEMYDLKHSNGILLWGPPGTGKTMIARTIGNMFGQKKIKIVNGPELLNKYVGQSEENLRNLFAEAEQEWEEKGEESDLHIIIFDEIDALFKQRGSHPSGSGVGDSLVNQLLTKLDGVDSAKNVLIIGMTNRKDLLDEALLRQGRMGVHIKIGLPDEKARLEIFEIHTRQLRANNLLEESIDLKEWANKTTNFTGADISGLINEAKFIANARNFKTEDGSKPVLKDLKNEELSRVTNQDFEEAFIKIAPSFGASNKLEPYLKKPFFVINKNIEEIIESVKMDITTFTELPDNPTRSILLTGPKGTGKTALAIHLTTISQAPFINLITSGDLAGLPEGQRIEKLDSEFKKAQQSKYSVIVMDNVEGIIAATPDGRSYSAQTLLKIQALLNDPAYTNLLVIGTSSGKEILKQIGLLESFKECEVNEINSYREVVRILKSLKLQKDEEVKGLDKNLPKPISIKKLLEEIHTFKALRKGQPWDTPLFLNKVFGVVLL